MTPVVARQLTNHYERGSYEAEQAHARLAARLRHLLPRRRLRRDKAGRASATMSPAGRGGRSRRSAAAGL